MEGTPSQSDHLSSATSRQLCKTRQQNRERAPGGGGKVAENNCAITRIDSGGMEGEKREFDGKIIADEQVSLYLK